jgi:hypothetical protein
MTLQNSRAVAPGEFEHSFCGWTQAGIVQVLLNGVLVEVPAGQWRRRGAAQGGYLKHAFAVLGCQFAENVVECQGVKNAHREDLGLP